MKLLDGAMAGNEGQEVDADGDGGDGPVKEKTKPRDAPACGFSFTNQTCSLEVMAMNKIVCLEMLSEGLEVLAKNGLLEKHATSKRETC